MHATQNRGFLGSNPSGSRGKHQKPPRGLLWLMLISDYIKFSHNFNIFGQNKIIDSAKILLYNRNNKRLEFIMPKCIYCEKDFVIKPIGRPGG